MLETSKGEILMGTTQGVYRYEPETKSMNRFYHEFSQKNCRVLYEDSKKRVWVGTYHDGLYCIDHGKVQSYDYPDTFNCMRFLNRERSKPKSNALVVSHFKSELA